MGGCCCGGNGKVRLLYACSGSANTGLLADQLARRLEQDGVGKMTCLAAVGAGHSGFVVSAQAADENILIDGCPVSCGKAIFEKAGLPFRHFKTADYGVVKGKTAITPEQVAEVAGKIQEEVQGERGTAGTASCCG